MTLQKDNQDKRAEAAELAAIQRNAVTVPLDKLIELQEKASSVDELVKALEKLVSEGRMLTEQYEALKQAIPAIAIAKSKGE